MNNAPFPKALLVLSLCFAFALVACQEVEPDSNAQQEATPTEAEKTVRNYLDAAYHARDLAALEEILADTITVNGEDHARNEHLARVQKTWESFPAMEEIDVTHIVGTEEYVTVRMILSGTGEGEYYGHDVEGKNVEVSEILLYHVSGGKIDKYWYNWDELSFWEQLDVLEGPATES